MYKSAIFILALLGSTLALPHSPVSLVQKTGVSKSSTLGIVDPTFRCGGLGTPFDLRISGCEGRCSFQPGTVYNCEKDFMPASAAPSLSLWVEICYMGVCTLILQTQIPNSSVQPGLIYTAKYSIVPNDFFSGRTIEFRGYIYHTDSSLMEVCVGAEAEIMALPH